MAFVKLDRERANHADSFLCLGSSLRLGALKALPLPLRIMSLPLSILDDQCCDGSDGRADQATQKAAKQVRQAHYPNSRPLPSRFDRCQINAFNLSIWPIYHHGSTTSLHHLRQNTRCWGTQRTVVSGSLFPAINLTFDRPRLRWWVA
jgi:hypothetical protein